MQKRSEPAAEPAAAPPPLALHRAPSLARLLDTRVVSSPWPGIALEVEVLRADHPEWLAATRDVAREDPGVETSREVLELAMRRRAREAADVEPMEAAEVDQVAARLARAQVEAMGAKGMASAHLERLKPLIASTLIRKVLRGLEAPWWRCECGVEQEARSAAFVCAQCGARVGALIEKPRPDTVEIRLALLSNPVDASGALICVPPLYLGEDGQPLQREAVNPVTREVLRLPAKEPGQVGAPVMVNVTPEYAGRPIGDAIALLLLNAASEQAAFYAASVEDFRGK